jgi:hypothetical protein
MVFYRPLPKKLWRVYVDLDKTLAYGTWKPDQKMSVIGEPILENIEKLRELVERGYVPYIHTSRHWGDLEMIRAWIEEYNIPIDPRHVICGKPLGDIYIDDKAVSSYADSWVI